MSKVLVWNVLLNHPLDLEGWAKHLLVFWELRLIFPQLVNHFGHPLELPWFINTDEKIKITFYRIRLAFKKCLVYYIISPFVRWPTIAFNGSIDGSLVERLHYEKSVIYCCMYIHLKLVVLHLMFELLLKHSEFMLSRLNIYHWLLWHANEWWWTSWYFRRFRLVVGKHVVFLCTPKDYWRSHWGGVVGGKSFWHRIRRLK